MLRFRFLFWFFLQDIGLQFRREGAMRPVGVGIDLDVQPVGLQKIFLRQGADSPGTADGLIQTNHLLGMVRHH